jgi:hypothetical protein
MRSKCTEGGGFRGASRQIYGALRAGVPHALLSARGSKVLLQADGAVCDKCLRTTRATALRKRTH